MLLQGMLILGLVLASVVTVQVSLVVIGSMNRLRGEAKSRSLERQILHEKLNAARIQNRRADESVLRWNGNRKFRIERKVQECANICSFYLRSHDKKPIPQFLPGQHLTFDVDIPGRHKRLVRCYSLSDRPQQDYYRVTVKRLESPEDETTNLTGRVSHYFHDQLKEGDIVDVRAPSGGFHLSINTNPESPVVLIGGGVGITPLMSMVNEIVETNSQREVWILFGARNRSEHLFREELEKATRSRANIRLHIAYSRAQPEDVRGKDYHHGGRISADLLKTLLPSNNYDYFLCGPGKMMESLHTGLLEWGVPEKHIHFEAFGPASIKKPTVDMNGHSNAQKLPVHFSKSGRDLMWDGQAESVLDLAALSNIVIDCGCRAGNCGTCKVAIKSGQVKYLKEPGYVVEAGTCLTCCCVPETEIVLDA